MNHFKKNFLFLITISTMSATSISLSNNRHSPYFNSVSCLGQGANTMCMVVGGLSTYLTNDAGKTWQPKDIDTSGWVDGEVKAVTCKQELADRICVAVGYYVIGWHTQAHIPLTLYNVNNGSWIQSREPDGPYPLTEVSCVGLGPTCFTAGATTGRSINGGKTWSTFPNNYRSTFTCFASHENQFCLASSHHEKNILKTIKLGLTWRENTIQNIPANSSRINIASFSCSDTTNTAFCIAVGNYKNVFSKTKPFIAISKDAGENWHFATPNNLPNGKLNSASCIKKENHFECTAVGKKENCGKESPYIIQTKDAGLTWQEQSISDQPNLSGYYNRVHCNQNTCTAVGKNTTSEINSSLFVQTDSTNKWQLVKLSGENTNKTEYVNMTCRGKGLTEVCVVVGDRVVVTNDGRQTWKIANLGS